MADTPDTRVKLDVIEVQEYADIPNYLQTAEEPYRIYYQPTFPNGTIWPVPYPVNTAVALANKLELFVRAQLAAFPDLASTSINLAPGYEDALTLTLEERVASTFGKQISPDLSERARHARASIQGVNSRAPKISTRDSGMPGSRC